MAGKRDISLPGSASHCVLLARACHQVSARSGPPVSARKNDHAWALDDHMANLKYYVVVDFLRLDAGSDRTATGDITHDD
jgi:hypothetical protein